MLRQFIIGSEIEKFSGHPEMDRQNHPVIKLDQDEFASARDTNNRSAFDSSLEGRLRGRSDQFGQSNFTGDDRATDNGTAQRAHDVLDLRQFRHEGEFDWNTAPESIELTDYPLLVRPR